MNRDRLRVDTLKWKLARMQPKKFGDKMDVTSDGQKIGLNFLPQKLNRTNDSDNQLDSD